MLFVGYFFHKKFSHEKASKTHEIKQRGFYYVFPIIARSKLFVWLNTFIIWYKTNL